jgi:hypothetical protein
MRFKWGHMMTAGCMLVAMSTQALADDTTADIRCVAAVLALSGKADAATKSTLAMSAIYYIGKLDGRVPSLDLEDALVKELSTMTAAEIGSEAVRCGKDLSVRGQQIKAMGDHMVARGASLSAEPAQTAK